MKRFLILMALVVLAGYGCGEKQPVVPSKNCAFQKGDIVQLVLTKEKGQVVKITCWEDGGKYLVRTNETMTTEVWRLRTFEEIELERIQ